MWGREPEAPSLSSPFLRAVSQPTTSDETVVAGGTVVLKCQVEDPDDSSLQWSNPAQQTLYFGEKRGVCAGWAEGRWVGVKLVIHPHLRGARWRCRSPRCPLVPQPYETTGSSWRGPRRTS